MKRSLRSIAVTTALAAVLTTALLTGCAFPGGSQTLAKPTSTVADRALEEIAGQVFSKGPNGETASPPSSADLTDEEVAQIKSLGLKAAIVMHYGRRRLVAGPDQWPQFRVRTLGHRGRRHHRRQVRPEQRRSSNLETVMAKKPDIIVSLPTDPVATAAAYREAAAGGRQARLHGQHPGRFRSRKGLRLSGFRGQLTATVSYPRTSWPKRSVARERSALIYHDADFFVTKQRYDGFRTTMEQDYPGIEIVEEQGRRRPGLRQRRAERRRRDAEQTLRAGRHLGGVGRAGRGCAGRRPRRRAPEPADRHRGPRQDRRDRHGQERPWSSASAPRSRSTRASPRPVWVPARSSASRRRRTSRCRALAVHSRERAGRLEAGLPRGSPRRSAEFLRRQ